MDLCLRGSGSTLNIPISMKVGYHKSHSRVDLVPDMVIFIKMIISFIWVYVVGECGKIIVYMQKPY